MINTSNILILLSITVFVITNYLYTHDKVRNSHFLVVLILSILTQAIAILIS